MLKSKKLLSSFLFSFSLSFLFLSLPVFLCAEEITITTYYPSPYGSYRQLTADQVAIGSAYRNPAYTDGTLYVSGKVGIGTTSPTNNLQINSLDANSFFRLTNTGTGSTSTDGLLIGVDGNGDSYLVNNENGRIEFRTSNTERMRISNTGNVGIGTTAPGTSKLKVAGTIEATGFKMPTGAVNNYVLTSDASGVANWQEASGAGGESIMYLEKYASSAGFEPLPAPCPGGWTEVDFQAVSGTDSANWRLYRRTCYRTEAGCRVMYLEKYASSAGFEPLPAPCPGGWTEVDFQAVSGTDAASRRLYRRTCYRCN